MLILVLLVMTNSYLCCFNAGLVVILTAHVESSAALERDLSLLYNVFFSSMCFVTKFRESFDICSAVIHTFI